MPDPLTTNHVKFYVESSQYPWVEIPQSEAKIILSHLNQLIHPVPLNPQSTSVRCKKLPFYPVAKLLSLTDSSTIPPITKYAIYNDSAENGYMVNWTNAPIYQANQTEPVLINEENVKDYIRFFYTFVAGRHGHFYIIESESDCHLVKMEENLVRLALQTLLIQKPLIQEKDQFVLDSLLYFKGSLTSVDVSIDRQGFMKMGNEKVIFNPPKSLRNDWDKATKS